MILLERQPARLHRCINFHHIGNDGRPLFFPQKAGYNTRL
jgi:hypothetical protein